MLIDWFTVAAQGVNFLILAWLLKRFLYGPIMDAMEERQQSLASEQAKSLALHEEANRRVQELREKQIELDGEAEAMLKQARADTDRQHNQWLAEAREEVAARTRAWMEALEREQASLSERLRSRMAHQVVSVAEKVLRDLAGEQLETIAIDGFLARSPASDSATRPMGTIRVATGFPMAQATEEQLRQSLRERFPQSKAIGIRHDRSLGFGIVMVVDDRKWEWNMASYLDEMEKAIFDELTRTKAAS